MVISSFCGNLNSLKAIALRYDIHTIFRNGSCSQGQPFPTGRNKDVARSTGTVLVMSSGSCVFAIPICCFSMLGRWESVSMTE